MRRLILFSLCVMCVSGGAVAQNEVGQWYLNPYVGGVTPDAEWATTGKKIMYGFDLGKNLSKAWSVELDLNGSALTYRYGDGHVRLFGGAFDALRVFNRGSTFAPYLSLGVGAIHDSPPDGFGLSSRTEFMAQGGIGAFIRLWQNSNGSRTIFLRPDLKARWSRVSGNPVDFLYVLGFTATFGPCQPAVAAPPSPPPPPPPPPPPASRCPGTPPGVAVDEYGCPIKDVVLEGVNFETDSAVLTAASRPILDAAAKGLREHPRLKIEVQGHTDSTGSARHNQGLSERRAASVRDYLIAQGVSPAQLTARGFGETQPIASNATVEGRAKNRRVVMHVLENPGDVPIRNAGGAGAAQQ
jgi:OOP family OmpA-OmpF porin